MPPANRSLIVTDDTDVFHMPCPVLVDWSENATLGIMKNGTMYGVTIPGEFVLGSFYLFISLGMLLTLVYVACVIIMRCKERRSLYYAAQGLFPRWLNISQLDTAGLTDYYRPHVNSAASLAKSEGVSSAGEYVSAPDTPIPHDPRTSTPRPDTSIPSMEKPVTSTLTRPDTPMPHYRRPDTSKPTILLPRTLRPFTAGSDTRRLATSKPESDIIQIV